MIERTKESVEKYEEGQRKEEIDLSSIESYLEKDDENDIPEDSREKVNAPKLAEGMIPIKYVNDNWVITNEDDKEWYDYSAGEKRWANVMLSDGTYKTSEKNYQTDGSTVVKENELGSMFVWIPRYAYSIKKYHTASNLTEGTTQEIFDIKFINGTGTKDFEGKSYGKSYDEGSITVGSPTPMIVHPGFTFGGTEFSGIWIAKFEASMTGENKNTTDENDKETHNKLSDTHSVKVLPNAETWRNISVEKSFLNCYNMNGDENIYGINGNQIDTHLIKNREWGLVAYLTASKYGSVPTTNTYNKSGRQEWAGGQNYKGNISQSTTKNITGIYDMNGGAWEYVAAYYDNLDQNLQDFGGKVLFNNRTLNESYTKYWDKYDVDVEEKKVVEKEGIYRNYDVYDAENSGNQKRKYLTDIRYNLMINKLGDAMHEVIGTGYSFQGKTTTNTRTWIKSVSATASEFGTGYYNGDYALLGNCLLTFTLRGGAWYYGNGTGIFTVNDISGYQNSDITFRPVLIIN